MIRIIPVPQEVNNNIVIENDKSEKNIPKVRTEEEKENIEEEIMEEMCYQRDGES
jgi:hypothetical protein